MFIEINEIGRYSTTRKDESGDTIYDTVIEGKILINTDEIRCISITAFKWADPERHIVEEGSQRYCVYFDKERYVNTDIESYNKIKKLVIREENNSIYE